MRKKDAAPDLSKIAGSLSHGEFWGESRKRIVISFSLVAGFFFIGLIALIAEISIEQANDPDSMIRFLLTILGLVFGFTAAPLALLILIIRNEKLRDQIVIWLNDSVELTAYSKAIGVWRPNFLSPATKIQVEFEMDGLHFSRESKGKLGVGCPEGHHGIWTKYANKPIRILYSPKYDEVLVLKEKKINPNLMIN